MVWNVAGTSNWRHIQQDILPQVQRHWSFAIVNIVTYTSMFNILKVSKLTNQTLTYLFFSKHGQEAHPFLWELEMIWKFDKRVKGRQKYTSYLSTRKFNSQTFEPLFKLAPTSLMEINLKPSLYLYYLIIWKKMKSNFQFKFQYNSSRHGDECSGNMSSIAQD